ncbi:hypothetical protein JCM10207_005233, partial [Rhodosporidiobolus poonsookiae]
TLTCASCPPFVNKCLSLDQALECGVNGEGKQLYLYIDGKCVEKRGCDESTYADGATRKCESCKLIDDDAETCTNPILLTCQTKFAYRGECVDPCPARFWGNPNWRACFPCSDPDALTCDATKSLTCATKYASPTGRCESSCPDGYFPRDSDHTCAPCSSLFGDGTASCTVNAPLTCKRGYVKNPQTGYCITDAQCAALNGGSYYAAGG